MSLEIIDSTCVPLPAGSLLAPRLCRKMQATHSIGQQTCVCAWVCVFVMLWALFPEAHCFSCAVCFQAQLEALSRGSVRYLFYDSTMLSALQSHDFITFCCLFDVIVPTVTPLRAGPCVPSVLFSFSSLVTISGPLLCAVLNKSFEYDVNASIPRPHKPGMRPVRESVLSRLERNRPAHHLQLWTHYL